MKLIIFYILCTAPFFCADTLLAQDYTELSNYEENVCPFEGCQFSNWVVKDTINVYANENDTTEIKFVLHKDDTIKAITGNIYYDRFGKVVITKPIYQFNVQDTLIVLRCTEGLFKVYNDGKIFETEMFWPTNENENKKNIENYFGKMIVPPKFTWWVKVQRNDKEGWLCLRNRSVYCFQLEERIEQIDILN